MRKLYFVRLTKQERVELQGVVKKLKGTGQKVRRAQILLVHKELHHAALDSGN